VDAETSSGRSECVDGVDVRVAWCEAGARDG
jgi:hypothetical protein